MTFPKSKLDKNQIFQDVHDSDDQALRTKMVETEISIETSAADGDSMQIQPVNFDLTATLGTAFDISAVKTMQVYVKSNAAGPFAVLKLYLSPLSSTDAFWIDSGISVQPGANLNDLAVSSLVTGFIAKRAKLTSTDVAPNLSVYVMARGN